MQKEKGYLLPDVAATEDMACTLVYYPDKPEYRRALGGSLAYLATWIAWEKESEHKGIDAALSWKTAYELTMDCWNMACLEDLQNNVAAILAIMEQGNACCDEQDITEGERYTDRVTDGEGDVPQNIIDAGYAADAADWDGFDDYKCMISHVIVDQIDARLIEYAKILTDYGPAAGTLAAVAGVFAVIFSGAGLAIAFGMVMGVGAVAFLYENLLGFPLLDDIIEKVQDNHDELSCAVYQADGDEGSLVALYDKIDELFTAPEAILLKSVNLGPTLKALYSGRYDQQDIAQTLVDAGYELDDFDCVCVPLGDIYGIEFIFDEIHGIGNPRYLFLKKWEDTDYWWWATTLRIEGLVSWTEHAIGVAAAEEGITPGAKWDVVAVENIRPEYSKIRVTFGVYTGVWPIHWDFMHIRIWLSQDGGESGSWHTADLEEMPGYNGIQWATLDDQASPNTLLLKGENITPLEYTYVFRVTPAT